MTLKEIKAMNCAENAKVLNSLQIVEIDFWKELYKSKENYQEYRKNDVYKYEFLFNEVKKEKNKGLDYGCGLVSMLEGHNIDFEACDPLIDEYRKIVSLDKRYLSALNKKYSWIWCVNVIDHENNWQEIVEDFKRLLKKRGKLFFEVNFDDNLSPAHSKLWRIDDVRESLKDFKLVKEDVYRLDSEKQSIYQGIYEI